MDYLILVNRDNRLSKDYIPPSLVDANSLYKKGIKIDSKTLEMFNLMKKEALKHNYNIDIMSAYRTYKYQKKIYSKLIDEKGYNYALRHIAPPGSSEHQTGLAVDICIYKDDKCYIEHDISELDELKWIHKNAYRFGFIIRYPEDKESITGYNYEPWHLRYVGSAARYIHEHHLSLEEYKKLVK